MLKPLSLKQLAKKLKGKLISAQPDAAAKMITSVSGDSRHLIKGDLFFAFTGAHHDGHAFIQDATRQGAAGAVISKTIELPDIPCIQVQNTLQAYGQLASINRAQFNKPVIAITGSNGKTSVKQMLYQLLAQDQAIYASEGNYNNEIGVPFSLLQLQPQHQAAVIELGARKPGDIDYLTHLVKPDIAIITHIGEAHIAYFGNQAAIARAKREIFHGLAARGTAIVPYDTVHYDLLIERLPRSIQQIRFSLHDHRADIYATNLSTEENCQKFTLVSKLRTAAEKIAITNLNPLAVEQSIQIHLPLLGQHNVTNFIAAAAAYLSLGFPIASLTLKTQSIQPIPGRLTPIILADKILLIDDSYNASPTSVKAAIEVLTNVTCYTHKVLVLGNMLELGDTSLDYHREIGHYAAAQQLDALFTLGDHAYSSLKVFKETAPKKHAQTAVNLDQLFSLVNQYITQTNDKTVLLVKGSHSMELGTLIKKLIATWTPKNIENGYGY